MNRETTPADAEHPTTVLLPLSGTDSRAVAELAERYERALADDGVRLADLAYTAGALSPHTAPHDGPRAAGVVATTGEARQWLADVSRQPPAAGLAPVDAGRLVLVFSGQGNQWLGMGRGLAAEPVAGRVLAECDEILTRLAGWSLTAELAATEETSRLEDPAVLQPVLVALQTAVVRQLESWGVVADACIGHSLGEISAAVACGALTLEDALYLAVVRGDLMREIVGSGRTALLGVSAEEAATRIARHGGDAEIAAWNAPRSTLIAGAAATVGRVVDELAVEEVFARMLPGSVAFHSRYVAPVHDKITELAGGIVARDAGTTMVSTVTGGVVPGSGLDSRYWGGNLREPVRFLQGVRFLADQGHRVFVEIGAHPTLSPSIIESLAGTEALVVPTLRRGVPERDALLTTAARLYEAGAALDFSALSPPDRRAVRLRPAPARRDTGPAVTVSPREAFGDLPGGLSLWRGTVTRTPAHGRFHLYGEPLASFALIAGTALAACPAGPYELDVRLAGGHGADAVAADEPYVASPAGSGAIEIHARTGEGLSPRATGVTRPRTGEDPGPVDVHALAARSGTHLAGSAAYTALAEAGLVADHPLVRDIWRGRGETLFRLTATTGSPVDVMVHCAVLLSAIPPDADAGVGVGVEGGAGLPVALDALTVDRPGAATWLLLRDLDEHDLDTHRLDTHRVDEHDLGEHAQGAGPGGGTAGHSVLVLDASGAVLAGAARLTLRHVPQAVLAERAAELAAARRAREAGAALDLAALAGADLGTRTAAIADFLRTELGRVLRMPADRVDPDRPLNGLGVDSIMGLELQGRLEAALGIEVKVVKLLRGDTVTEVAADLAARLDTGTPAAAAQAAGLDDPREIERLLANLDMLPPEEVDSLLQRLATGAAGTL